MKLLKETLREIQQGKYTIDDMEEFIKERTGLDIIRLTNLRTEAMKFTKKEKRALPKEAGVGIKNKKARDKFLNEIGNVKVAYLIQFNDLLDEYITVIGYPEKEIIKELPPEIRERVEVFASGKRSNNKACCIYVLEQFEKKRNIFKNSDPEVILHHIQKQDSYENIKGNIPGIKSQKAWITEYRNINPE